MVVLSPSASRRRSARSGSAWVTPVVAEVPMSNIRSAKFATAAHNFGGAAGSIRANTRNARPLRGCKMSRVLSAPWLWM